MLGALAAISYDPQIRGFLIVLVAVFALCGSTYLLVATNTGARLGFLLAAAGLMGWITVLSFVWTVYGIGPKGSEPAWKVTSVVAGQVGPTAAPVLTGFPKGWRTLPEGDQKRAEAQAAVDETIAGTKAIPAASSLGFAKSSDYLPLDAYDRGGQKTGLFGLDVPRPLNVKHKPHYAVIQVQAVVTTTTTAAPQVSVPDLDNSATPNGTSSAGGNQAGAAAQATPSANAGSSNAGVNANNPNTAGATERTGSTTTVPGGTTPTTGTGVVSGQGTTSGAGEGQNASTAQADQPSDQTNKANPSTPAKAAATPAKPVPDPAKPVVTVLMERDLGSLRLPPLIVCIFSGILFAILCGTLHFRDKRIMAEKAAAEERAGGTA
jgi:hypothetical protein